MRQRKLQKVISSALICGMCLSMMPGIGWANQERGIINGSNVNIRTAASTDTKSLGKLQKGDQVEILSSKDGWYQVKTSAGKTGWVAGWLIDLQQTRTATVSEDVVNIRSGAGTHFDRVSQCKKGDKLTIIGEQADWYQVQLANGKTGWVANWLVTVEGSSSTNQPSQPNPTPPATSTVTPPPTGTTVPSNTYPVVVSGDNVHIRKGPGINHDSLGKVNSGQELLVSASQDSWLKVDYNGQVGWIASWLIVEKNPTTTPSDKEIMLTLQGDQTLVINQLGNDVFLSFRNVASSQYKISQEGRNIQVQVNNGNFSPQTYPIDKWGIGKVAVSGQLITIHFNGEVTYTEKHQADPVALNITAKVSGVDNSTNGTTQNTGQVVMVKKIAPTEKNTALELTIASDSGYRVQESSANKLVVIIDKASVGSGATKFINQQTAVGPITAISAKDISGNQVELTIALNKGAYCHLYKVDNTLYINGTVKNTANSQGLSGKVIVLDPGHGTVQSGGWTDPGAVGSALGVTDRDIGLTIAKQLKQLLEAQGAKVIMTHTGRTTLTLAGRAGVANDLNADVFISIHGNANNNPKINGIEVYHYAPDSLPNIAAQRYVRNDLATSVKQGMVAVSGRPGQVLSKNLAVLRENAVPSILVEAGYVSNKEEEALLAQESYLNKLAQGICDGLGVYFNH